MTWTAKLVSVERVNGMPQATVEFTDGKEVITQKQFGDTFNAVALKEWVYVKLQSLNGSEVAFTSLNAEAKGANIVPVKPALKVI
jgi:hypothetical protein